jgi:hypothetical protein
MIPTLSAQQTCFAANVEYLPGATVRRIYGLPPTWIRRLGRPDQIDSDLRRSTTTIALYSRGRVEAFLEAHQAAYLRMLVAQARRHCRRRLEACRQAQAFITWARTVEIVVAALPETMTELKQETVASFLTRSGYSPDQCFVLTEKAVVAHLRHHCTNYHRLLARLKHRPGSKVAYLILKRRVNQAVRHKLRQQYGAKLAEAR